MRLKELIQPELIILDAEIKDTSQMIDFVADLMASAMPSLERDFIKQGFLDREVLGGTYVGDGIALPHARVAPPGKELLAVIRPKVPIANSDGEDINLIVATVTDPGHPEGHLNLLSSLARILHKDSCRKALREATSVGEVVHLLSREGEPGPRFYELLLVVLTDDEAVHDFLNMLARMGVQGATAITARGMAEILSSGPSLFAGFRELFGAVGSARLVISAMDATMTEQVMERFRTWRKESESGGVAFSVPISGAIGLNRDEF